MSQKKQEEQEIDLTQISKYFKKFIKNVKRNIFRSIQFCVKHKFILAGLVVGGVSLGYVIDKTTIVYENNVVVKPNFNSTENLYQQIELINDKIKQNDVAFLSNQVGIKKLSKLAEVRIEPVVDFYTLMNSNEKNIEIFKLFAEKGDTKKLIKDEILNNNYVFHKIVYVSSGEVNEKEIQEPLLKYLNKSQYFNEIQKISYENIEKKIVENDSTITQINNILNGFSRNIISNSKALYNSENLQLNDILNTKNNLISEQASLRLNLVNSQTPVKEIASTLNVEKKVNSLKKMKYIFPVLLVLFYLVFRAIRSFYKKQLLLEQKREEKKKLIN